MFFLFIYLRVYYDLIKFYLEIRVFIMVKFVRIELLFMESNIEMLIR